MREWNCLHRGGQLWGCLQAAELSSREQLNLWLRRGCLLEKGERIPEDYSSGSFALHKVAES